MRLKQQKLSESVGETAQHQEISFILILIKVILHIGFLC